MTAIQRKKLRIVNIMEFRKKSADSFENAENKMRIKFINLKMYILRIHESITTCTSN